MSMFYYTLFKTCSDSTLTEQVQLEREIIIIIIATWIAYIGEGGPIFSCMH